MHVNLPFDKPSQVVAEAGEVLIDGPDGIAVAMTPAAAEETGRRLIEAAAEARNQLDRS
jgi:putative intracellular protease/amidase